MDIPRRISPTFVTQIDGRSTHLLCHPLEQMEANQWHRFRGSGNWDVTGLKADHLALIFHSKNSADSHPMETGDYAVDSFSFKLSDKVYVSFNSVVQSHGDLDVWATTPEMAEQHYFALCSQYGRASIRRRQYKATLLMLNIQHGVVGTEPVSGLKSRLTGKPDLALHYGDEFASWSDGYLNTLRGSHHGLSIFRGPPGTGKTNYLRYLIHKLKRSHTFYYLPVSDYGRLSDPQMSQFWIRENLLRTGIKKVIILEDAEPLLLERSGGNWAHLSNLLNVSDGLLGEFLRVHVLCTMNAEVTQIDAAVLRTGRLLACREFTRLCPGDARRLAEMKGLQLKTQSDYSLAEIYDGGKSVTMETGFPKKRRMGFQVVRAC